MAFTVDQMLHVVLNTTVVGCLLACGMLGQLSGAVHYDLVPCVCYNYYG